MSPNPTRGTTRVPFNRPFVVGKELLYISQAVLSGTLAGDGEFTKRCCALLEREFGARKVMLTHSCTAALEISALLANVGPGDEVIMPSYTFVSTANAFVLRGAKVRFVDIREDTLNIDERLIEAAINERTKAIVPIHYAGVGAEMDTICDIAARHDLLVIEDAAQGVDATYRDRHLGTIGQLGTYSFHETKNLISGEGGALLINDERLVERAEILRDKGTNRSKFFRGEVDKYSWVDLGSSYLPSELIAAFLLAQLEEMPRITGTRRRIFERYERAFRPLAAEGRVRLPFSPEHCRHNAHMFYLLLPEEKTRDALIERLHQHSLQSVFHYVPLHASRMGRQTSANPGERLPITESASSRLVRLPCYFELGGHDQERVINAVTEFLLER